MPPAEHTSWVVRYMLDRPAGLKQRYKYKLKSEQDCLKADHPRMRALVTRMVTSGHVTKMAANSIRRIR